MDGCKESLGDAKVFSIFAVSSGYWQIEVERSYREKTAFPSNNGSFPITDMLLGLKNVHVTFQRIIKIMLSQVK